MFSTSIPILLLSLVYATSAIPLVLRSTGAIILLPAPLSQQRGAASSVLKPRIKLGSSYQRVRTPIPKSYNIHPHVIKAVPKPATSSSASSSTPESTSVPSTTSTSYSRGATSVPSYNSIVPSNSTASYALGFSSQATGSSGSSASNSGTYAMPSSTASASSSSSTSISKRRLRNRARLEFSH